MHLSGFLFCFYPDRNQLKQKLSILYTMYIFLISILEILLIILQQLNYAKKNWEPRGVNKDFLGGGGKF